MTATKRYSITRTHEQAAGKSEFIGADGNPKPLVYEFDTIEEATSYLHSKFGGRGEIVDHQTRQAYSPGNGWYDVSAYLDALAGTLA